MVYQKSSKIIYFNIMIDWCIQSNVIKSGQEICVQLKYEMTVFISYLFKRILNNIYLFI